MTTATRERPAATGQRKGGSPLPLEVSEDLIDGVLWLYLDGRWCRARSIDNLWEITGECWQGRPVLKMRFRVAVDGRSPFIMFQDLLDGAWYLEGNGQPGTGDEVGRLELEVQRQAAPKTANTNHRAA